MLDSYHEVIGRRGASIYYYMWCFFPLLCIFQLISAEASPALTRSLPWLSATAVAMKKLVDNANRRWAVIYFNIFLQSYNNLFWHHICSPVTFVDPSPTVAGRLKQLPATPHIVLKPEGQRNWGKRLILKILCELIRMHCIELCIKSFSRRLSLQTQRSRPLSRVADCPWLSSSRGRLGNAYCVQLQNSFVVYYVLFSFLSYVMSSITLGFIFMFSD
jgi:hypothetical protein